MATDTKEKKKLKLPEGVKARNIGVLGPFKHKFQVLAGADIQPIPVLDEEGNLILDDVLVNGQPTKEDGKRLVMIRTKDTLFGPRREAGDIVMCNIDLAKRYNRPNSIKYRHLDVETGDPFPEELKASRLETTDAQKRYAKSLDKMTVRQLIDTAEEDGVDLGGKTKKEEIIPILLRAANITPTI